MKVNIEIDCTPGEAREFMGLPDVGKANEFYVDAVTSAMKSVAGPDQMQDFVKQLAPMGQAGLKLFQNFVEGSIAAGSAAASVTNPAGSGNKKK
ncbi:MAG: DUF6489 family protein [Sphingomonadaceae bacterium]